MPQRKQQGKTPKERKKQPNDHVKHHPSAYQRERVEAVSNKKRKDRRAQG